MKYIEEWRTAVYDGEVYEGLYKVSNLGRILSLNYRNTGKAELRTPVEMSNGYLQIGLSKNGECKKCYVHRLVAQTFIPNPDNLPEINHIDEDKTNNRVDNIEWKSHKDNINHGTRTERVAKARSKRVIQLSLSGEFIREWTSTMECERNGFNHSAVGKCCNGNRKTHKGFRFMYAEDYKESQLKELGYIPLF